jgi:CRISPR-associated protein Csb1
MSLMKEIENATYLVLTEELYSPTHQVTMPSYAGDREGEQKFVTWKDTNGMNAMLDSVQSQANRMEPIFKTYDDLVPATVVKYPNGSEKSLLDISHRCADPLIRYHFDDELRELKAGNAVRLAKRNPTALLFGLDARTLWVKQQRLITSMIEVRNAYRLPHGSSLNPDVDEETKRMLVEQTGMKASEIGVDQVPTFSELSGVLDTTSATITRRVAFPISLLDIYQPILRDYLKGLGLVAMLHPLPLNLRSGTELVRKSRVLEAYDDNTLSSKHVPLDSAFEDALQYARAAAKTFGIGKPEILVIDVKRVVEGAKAQSERKAAKKTKRQAAA